MGQASRHGQEHGYDHGHCHGHARGHGHGSVRSRHVTAWHGHGTARSRHGKLEETVTARHGQDTEKLQTRNYHCITVKLVLILK